MSREASISALQTIVSGAYPWVTGPSRRLKLWSDVPVSERPACFLFEGGNETYAWPQGATPKREIEVKLFIYINTKDPGAIGAQQINNIMDALDTAFSLKGNDLILGRNTMNGTAYLARIDGNPMKDPGDLDGDAMLIVPVKITLP